MSLAITERTSLWRIVEYNGRPDLASILESAFDSRVTGRIMLHMFNGRVIGVEICERFTFERAEIPSLDFPVDIMGEAQLVSHS
jgi:hypothetical protein